MACPPPPPSAALVKSSFVAPLLLFPYPHNTFHLRPNIHLLPIRTTSTPTASVTTNCSSSTISSTLSWSSDTDQEQEEEEEEEEYDDFTEDEQDGNSTAAPKMGHAPPLRMRRRRYRKQYPGEKVGITEEMRFVAMKLRNTGKPKKHKTNSDDDTNDEELDGSDSLPEENNDNGETWEPSIEGFLKYLVDSKHIFSTIERIVDESSDVSYVYFRKTGLERAECLSRDLEWFFQEGNSLPEPSNPGIVYAQYLEEIAEKSPALFMSHFYNIYFSHIAGGQVIAKKVSQKLLDGRELEFFTWEGNEEELLRGVRDKLNMLGEHWSRDEKNKCLREATKSFRFLGQIVRLIIL